MRHSILININIDVMTTIKRDIMKIVLVCIGQLQIYIKECVAQLMVWGNTDISVITDTDELRCTLIDHLPASVSVTVVRPKECAGLFERFESTSRLDHGFRNGFFRHCFKRFIYLCEYMKTNGLVNIVHFENDVMVYRNTDDWKPFFDHPIHLTMDSSNRCIPSIMYFRDYRLLEECLSQTIVPRENDMEFWARCWKQHRGCISQLPIIFPDAGIPREYHEHFRPDVGIFDAAAIGQYLGGVNPENDDRDTRGFVNETCVVRYDRYPMEWQQDLASRLWRPMIRDNSSGHWVVINNLHIHSKRLSTFSSRPVRLADLEQKLFLSEEDVFSKGAFRKLADHFSYAPLLRPVLNSPVIWVDESYVSTFLASHHVFIRRRFVLLCQNANAPSLSPEEWKKCLQHPNCLSIFMQVPPEQKYDKIHILPFGISTEQSVILKHVIYQSPYLKKRLICSPLPIPELYPFVDVQPRIDDYQSYLLKLSEYKYCYVPKQNNNEAEFYRLFWDCIRMQVVPVLLNHEIADIQPVVTLRSWHDVLNAVDAYTFPNYPLYDAKSYKEQVTAIINDFDRLRHDVFLWRDG